MRQIEGVADRLEVLFADQAYQGALEDYVAYVSDWRLEIVRKPADQKGFVVHAKRWLVERTLAWLSRYRGLAKDYEFDPESSEAMLKWAAIRTMLRRLTKRPDT